LLRARRRLPSGRRSPKAGVYEAAWRRRRPQEDLSAAGVELHGRTKATPPQAPRRHAAASHRHPVAEGAPYGRTVPPRPSSIAGRHLKSIQAPSPSATSKSVQFPSPVATSKAATSKSGRSVREVAPPPRAQIQQSSAALSRHDRWGRGTRMDGRAAHGKMWQHFLRPRLYLCLGGLALVVEQGSRRVGRLSSSGERLKKLLTCGPRMSVKRER
jgi:hypothetical protein